MTTSITPTHGSSLRHEPLHLAQSDAERWLPDPSWPVPPRGWQLWAAAGPAGREAVTSGGSDSVAFEDLSFTLPSRPGLDRRATVDLLADRPRRHAPDGTIRGFAVLGALVLFSVLVGGPMGGLVVVGVSTLLAAVAALIEGRATLSQVGGHRGASWLLGAAVTALITGSFATHEQGPSSGPLPGTLVPVSSPPMAENQTSYAVVPPSGVDTAPAAKPSAPTGASERSTTAATGSTAGSPSSLSASPASSRRGPTLAPDALAPRAVSPDAAPAQKAPVRVAAEAMARAEAQAAHAGKQAATSTDKAASKAANTAAKKAATSTQKAEKKAATSTRKAEKKAATSTRKAEKKAATSTQKAEKKAAAKKKSAEKSTGESSKADARPASKGKGSKVGRAT